MSERTSPMGLPDAAERSQWIRLRTLIWLRWVAVAGQLVALGVAQWQFDLHLPVWPCLMVIGLAVMANIAAILLFPEATRLSETAAVLMLLFDLFQLGLLLFLTGGLNNPFSILILTPVTISATALRLQSTLIVGGAALAQVVILRQFHLPIQTYEGTVLALPELFSYGFLVAIIIGIGFLSVYAGRVTAEMNAMSNALSATQMALAREQKLTDLGGVVAATAHELGTPLATIKLVSSELAQESGLSAEVREDAELIRDQANRCSDILHSMGQAGKDDLHMRSVPLGALVENAAEPHQNRGKALRFAFGPLDPAGGEGTQPMVPRRPEILHGLRNLIQNGVDFAETSVWIDGVWTDTIITIRIADDGPGFGAQELGRIGDPFLRRRRVGTGALRRPGYRGMGLGLFIAKTLLERTGAQLAFFNTGDARARAMPLHSQRGAVVDVTWPAELLRDPRNTRTAGLGENRPLAD